jgi:hypothetical protein
VDRLEILKDREAKIDEYQAQISEELKDFSIVGKRLFKTSEGKQFLLLAKKLYYDPNEYQRDNFYSSDPLCLARLNGEDFVLRKVIMQFLSQDNADNIGNTNNGGNNE